MQKCKGTPSDALLLPTKENKNFNEIISKNREEFMQYIEKLGLNVEYRNRTQNYQTTSTTILTLKTRCFKVDFNDNFVKISALK